MALLTLAALIGAFQPGLLCYAIPFSDGCVLDLIGHAYVQDWNTNTSNWPNWMYAGRSAHVPSGVNYSSEECAFFIPPRKVISAPYATGPADMPDASYAAWIKVPAAQSQATGWLLSLAPFQETNRGIQLKAGKIGFTGIVNASDSVNVPTDTWIHVAGVWTQTRYGTNHAYLNGKEIGTVQVDVPMENGTSGHTFIIGGRSSGLDWLSMNIQVSEVAVFERWLSPSEVERLYSAGRSCQGACDNPTASNLSSLQEAPAYLPNRYSRKCIDVVGMSAAVPTSWLQVWDCFYDKPTYGQEFVLTREGQIRHVLSGLCIDVAGVASVATRSAAQLYHCDPLAQENISDQFWDLSEEGFLRNRLNCKCLDVEGAPGVVNGYVLKLHDCDALSNANSDQRWTVSLSNSARRLTINSRKGLKRSLQTTESTSPSPIMITFQLSTRFDAANSSELSFDEQLVFQQLMQKAIQNVTQGDIGWTSSYTLLQSGGSGSRIATTYIKLLVDGNKTAAEQTAAVLDEGDSTLVANAIRSASLDLSSLSAGAIAFQQNLTQSLGLQEIKPIKVAGPTNFTPARTSATGSTTITSTSSLSDTSLPEGSTTITSTSSLSGTSLPEGVADDNGAVQASFCTHWVACLCLLMSRLVDKVA
eukprot:TRINITY_DN16826_c0_g1_i2.p1 TRINITY_DN16826_c0_g1~~TRINITY_DN16826_c0_g1_i2.p1  ORF type:complete len:671 (-),score=84.25 TRINITY_DN16826_c0_g1_i2:16-1947(-)